MELITPNVGTLFWMIIIFSVVAFILKRFAWKPILNALYKREESIESALNAAREARLEVELLKANNEKIIAKAREEKESILREAMTLKEGIIAEAREKSATDMQKTVENARKQILNEKEKAVNDMKKQITELSFVIAEKIIRKELSDEKQHHQLVREVIDEIKLN
jgi:F-type H+-transporting ATPase subunit b